MNWNWCIANLEYMSKLKFNGNLRSLHPFLFQYFTGEIEFKMISPDIILEKKDVPMSPLLIAENCKSLATIFLQLSVLVPHVLDSVADSR